MRIETMVCGAYQANCYRVHGKNGDFLIDPGDEPARFGGMKDISAILLTHGHFDHMLSARTIRENTGAKIYVAAEDADMLTGAFPNQYREEYALQPFVPFEADALYPESGILSVCGEDIRVLKTPGHTQGSVCLWCGGTLFTGDTVFAQGYGRTDMTGGSARQLRESLFSLLSLPENPRVLSGHGEASDLDGIRRFFRFTAR